MHPGTAEVSVLYFKQFFRFQSFIVCRVYVHGDRGIDLSLVIALVISAMKAEMKIHDLKILQIGFCYG